MQKLVDQLERNVEWIALGLAGLFLLVMAFNFLVQSPVAVTLAENDPVSRQRVERTAGPGEVDEYIARGPAQQLQMAINDTTPLPMAVASFTEEFRQKMLGEPPPFPLQLASAWSFHSQVGGVPEAAPGPGETPRRPDIELVRALPVPPPAQFAAHSTGRGYVAALPPGQQQHPDQWQEEQWNPGAAAAMPTHGKDIDWVSLKFNVPMNELAEAFAQAQIPDELRGRTLFLQVELVRRELRPDGTPGEETVIPPLAIHPLVAFPGDDVQQQLMYRNWAQNNQPLLIQPEFYPVLRGEPWIYPGWEPVMEERMFDPATFDGNLLDLPMELRRQVIEYRREQERLRQMEERPQPRPRPQPRTRGQEMYSPRQIEPNVQLAQVRPMRPYTRSEFEEEERWRRDEEPPPWQPGGQPAQPRQPWQPRPPQDQWQPRQPDQWQPQPEQPEQPTVPVGQFNPADFQEITILAHDGTVEAGKSYQYKLRYRLANPIHRIHNVAEPAELADVFALTSRDSEWTERIGIPGRIDFFFTRSGVRDSVGFDVFRWHEGAWHQQQFLVSYGDIVGQSRQDVDYNTGWTMVDIRTDPLRQETVAVLIDDDGNTQNRTIAGDRVKPRFQELRQQVQEARDAVQARRMGEVGAGPWD